MEELSKFEALWSEIRQSQYLTEENIKKIDNLLKELKELENSNSDYVNKLTKLYDITNKLLLNLQAVNQNFNKNVENLNKTIANSIKNISTKDIELTIKSKLYDLKKELEKEIKKLNDEIKNNLEKENKKLMNTASDFKLLNEDLLNTKNKLKDAITQLNKTKENLNKKIKSVNFKWIAIALALGLAGGVLASQVVTQYFLYKYELKKAIELAKKSEEEKYLKAIQKLKEENEVLKKFQVPKEYIVKDNNGKYYIRIKNDPYKVYTYIPLDNK